MLTEEQKKIAEENHNLIYFFIRHFNVDTEEYYDLFAIDYLKCIEVWDEKRGSLSALLTRAFSNRIKNEIQKDKRKRDITFISLNNTVSKEKEIYLQDVIPDIRVNIQQKIEFREDIAFFSEYTETQLLMQGFTLDEIAFKTNMTIEQVKQNIKNIKSIYEEQKGYKNRCRKKIEKKEKSI